MENGTDNRQVKTPLMVRGEIPAETVRQYVPGSLEMTHHEMECLAQKSYKLTAS